MRKVKLKIVCIMFDYKIKGVKKKTLVKRVGPYIIGPKTKEKERLQ